MSSLVRMFELISAHFGRHLFDLAATGRTFVQAAFWTQRRPRLAAFLAEDNFATFAAEGYIPAAVDRCAAAQGRSFMQAADGACRDSLFAALFAPLLFAAQTTQRDLGIGIVCVRDPERFLTATRKSGQPCCQTQQQHA
jgi:hypothetical protein